MNVINIIERYGAIDNHAYDDNTGAGHDNNKDSYGHNNDVIYNK